MKLAVHSEDSYEVSRPLGGFLWETSGMAATELTANCYLQSWDSTGGECSE